MNSRYYFVTLLLPAEGDLNDMMSSWRLPDGTVHAGVGINLQEFQQNAEAQHAIVEGMFFKMFNMNPTEILEKIKKGD